MIVYEKRVICFIDILGFKSHIDKSIQDENHIETISIALDAISDVMDMEVDDAKYRNIDVNVTQFSDSVVLSYDINGDDQLAFVIMSISTMVSRLLQYGFLLRGAITQGKVIHTNKQLFGPAMNEAYELESEHACYPRIIVPRKVFERATFSTDVGDMAKSRVLYNCTMDEDGWYFIDYISSDRCYSDAKNHMQDLQILCKIIDNNIETSEKSILKKYAWLNTKLSHELTITKDTYPNMSKEELELLATLKEQIAKFDTAINYSY